MARTSDYDVSLCDDVLIAFEGGKSITAACVKLNISTDTYYNYKKRHPEFLEAASLAEAKAQCFMEDLGMKGMLGQIEKFNGPLFQFFMRNRYKHDYSETAPGKTVADTVVERLIDKLQVSIEK